MFGWFALIFGWFGWFLGGLGGFWLVWQGFGWFRILAITMKDFALKAFSVLAISQGSACFDLLNAYERFCSYSIQCPCNQSRFSML